MLYSPCITFHTFPLYTLHFALYTPQSTLHSLPWYSSKGKIQRCCNYCSFYAKSVLRDVHLGLWVGSFFFGRGIAIPWARRLWLPMYLTNFWSQAEACACDLRHVGGWRGILQRAWRAAILFPHVGFAVRSITVSDSICNAATFTIIVVLKRTGKGCCRLGLHTAVEVRRARWGEHWDLRQVPCDKCNGRWLCDSNWSQRLPRACQKASQTVVLYTTWTANEGIWSVWHQWSSFWRWRLVSQAVWRMVWTTAVLPRTPQQGTWSPSNLASGNFTRSNLHIFSGKSHGNPPEFFLMRQWSRGFSSHVYLRDRAGQEKLYSTPQDVFNVYKGLNPISHMWLAKTWLWKHPVELKNCWEGPFMSTNPWEVSHLQVHHRGCLWQCPWCLQGSHLSKMAADSTRMGGNLIMLNRKDRRFILFLASFFPLQFNALSLLNQELALRRWLQLVERLAMLCWSPRSCRPPVFMAFPTSVMSLWHPVALWFVDGAVRKCKTMPVSRSRHRPARTSRGADQGLVNVNNWGVWTSPLNDCKILQYVNICTYISMAVRCRKKSALLMATCDKLNGWLKYGQLWPARPLNFVFHGGSGSEKHHITTAWVLCREHEQALTLAENMSKIY